MDNPTSPNGTRPGILLADDHQLFRHCVRKLLRNMPDFELVGEAGNGEEAVWLAGELESDIVIMDVVMPVLNGLEATRLITQECPSVRVIALSIHGDSGFRRAMLDAGASTFLLKDNVCHELPGILRSMVAGTV